MNNKFPTIVKKNNLLVVAKNHLAIVNKLLPYNNDQLIWWNGLSYEWKNIFWKSFFEKFGITLEDFQGELTFYLDRLMTISILPLDDNQITDISALGCLTQLRILSLYNNRIQDISVLGNLTQLTKLWLANNQIFDISPLTSLINLEYLNLEGNPITQKDIDWLQSKLPNCEIEF